METQIETNVKQPAPSLFGIFTSPGEQFERIRSNPKIWVPLLIVAVINTIGMWLMSEMIDPDTLTKDVPKDQAEVVLMVAKIGMIASGALSPLLGGLISSAIELGIAKAAKAPVTFKQLFSMNTYIGIVSAVGHLLNMAIGYAIGMDGETHITSLAGLLGKDGSGVLGTIEFFGIWAVILTAIGLNKTGRYPKGLAWTIAILFFLFGVGMAAVSTLLQGAPKL